MFRDTTGRPGPSTWAQGEYPHGQDDYPVTGVSWYEAAAYAESAGKALPTIYHWTIAASPWGSAGILPAANFDGPGPARVGSSQAMSWSGAYDMAGNVKEWCWNEASLGDATSWAALGTSRRTCSTTPTPALHSSEGRISASAASSTPPPTPRATSRRPSSSRRGISKARSPSPITSSRSTRASSRTTRRPCEPSSNPPRRPTNGDGRRSRSTRRTGANA